MPTLCITAKWGLGSPAVHQYAAVPVPPPHLDVNRAISSAYQECGARFSRQRRCRPQAGWPYPRTGCAAPSWQLPVAQVQACPPTCEQPAQLTRVKASAYQHCMSQHCHGNSTAFDTGHHIQNVRQSDGDKPPSSSRVPDTNGLQGLGRVMPSSNVWTDHTIQACFICPLIEQQTST